MVATVSRKTAPPTFLSAQHPGKNDANLPPRTPATPRLVWHQRAHQATPKRASTRSSSSLTSSGQGGGRALATSSSHLSGHLSTQQQQPTRSGPRLSRPAPSSEPSPSHSLGAVSARLSVSNTSACYESKSSLSSSTRRDPRTTIKLAQRNLAPTSSTVFKPPSTTLSHLLHLLRSVKATTSTAGAQLSNSPTLIFVVASLGHSRSFFVLTTSTPRPRPLLKQNTMQVRTALRLAAFCLAGSIFVGSVTAKATRDDRLKRQYEYGYSQPIGAISVYSPPEALRTCAPTDVTWQWTGDVTITNTVAIYIQSVALSTIAKRDAGSHQAQACSGAKRMHKMRRGAEANLDSNAASQHLEARADSRLLAADVSLVGQSWEWDSVNVNPGVYRYVVVMQQGSTSPAIYGRSPIFAVVAGSDASCLGSGVAAGMPTTSSAITWGVAPVSSTSSSSSSTTASAPSGVSTPAPVSSETSSPSTGMTLATGNPAASSTNASVPPAESVVNSSTGSSGGVHGGVIAAVVILPLAALIALGMGLFYILKKRREGSNGPYLRSTPSFDALHGAGSTSAGAGTWANRFLASGASRNGGMVNGENTFAELDAEKSGDNRASVFSDLYGGMGETADQFAAMRSTASAVSVSGRPSMADVSLADTPYIYCHSVTTVAQTPNPGSARPSMNSVRGLPISSPMPLHVEDRPAQGTSFDLPRGASSTAGQETVTSPTDSERAFSAGGWPRYANVGKEDVEGAHALTRDEVDTMVVHTPASVGDDATAARKNGLPPLPPSLGARLSTIQGSRGSYVSGPFDNSFQGEAAPSPSLPSHEREMPYPDTPRPYSVKRVSGSTAGHGRFEAGPSSPSPPSMPTVDQRRRGSAGAVTATQPSFPPRSASSMSGKYVNSASGREPGAGPSSPYATLQRSASNGSTFTVRRKPVPGSAAALAAAAATTTTAPSATATAAATSADPEVSASPFADEHAVQVDTAPSSEPVEASEPQEVVVSPSASTTSVAAAAATAEEEDKKEYKLSVDFNIEPLRFSKF